MAIEEVIENFVVNCYNFPKVLDSAFWQLNMSNVWLL
jgi:hypothetical protein